MPKFTKKKPVFEAFRWDGKPATCWLPDWFRRFITEGEVEFIDRPMGRTYLRLKPPVTERPRTVSPSDWVVLSEDGLSAEVVDDERFRRQYERIL